MSHPLMMKLPKQQIPYLVAAIALCLLSATCAKADKSTYIRVLNASSQDFQYVGVAGKAFGNIASGAVTEYQVIPGAFRYMDVALEVGTTTMEFKPIDYIGEKPLGPGHFTLWLTITESGLNLEATKDRDN